MKHARVSIALSLVCVLGVCSSLAAGEVIVATWPGSVPHDVLEGTGAEVLETIPALRMALVRLPDEGMDVALEARAEVRFVESQIRHRLPECDQSSVWFLEHRGPVLRTPRDVSVLADPTPATRVALLDGAVDAGHPWVETVYSGGWDFVDDDPDPGVLGDGVPGTTPGEGHGTAMASIIGRSGDGLELLVYRVIGDDCIGTSWDVARGIVQAVRDGARVLALPLGSEVPSSAVNEALAYAARFDVLVFAAAGNEGSSRLHYPARDVDAVAIGALDATDDAASFTSYGPQVDLSDHGVDLRVAAPGGGSARVSGTSVAAVRSALAATRLRRLLPHWTADEVLILMLETSAPLQLTDHTYEKKLGAGRTDYRSAVREMGGLALDERNPNRRTRVR